MYQSKTESYRDSYLDLQVATCNCKFFLQVGSFDVECGSELGEHPEVLLNPSDIRPSGSRWSDLSITSRRSDVRGIQNGPDVGGRTSLNMMRLNGMNGWQITGLRP